MGVRYWERDGQHSYKSLWLTWFPNKQSPGSVYQTKGLEALD